MQKTILEPVKRLLSRPSGAKDGNHNRLADDEETSGVTTTTSARSVSFLVWKNVILTSMAVLIKASGYYSIQNIQSSIHSENGLGVVTLAIVTGGGIVGGFMAGPLLTHFDPKWVYLAGSLPMALYVGANFYPSWAVFIPAGIIYGLASGVAAVALKVFLARLARVYYLTYNGDVDRITTRVFMCEIVASKLSMVIGNLASSLFLEQEDDDDHHHQDDGQSMAASLPDWQCGAAYCNEDMNAGPGGSRPSSSQINALTGFGVTAVLLGCLMVLVLVDPVRRAVMAAVSTQAAKRMLIEEGERDEESHGGAPGGSLWTTCRMLGDRRLLLLLPSFLIFTAGDTFWTADFTKAFISCSLGVEMVGLVSLWMGVSGAVASISFGMFNSEDARTFSLTVASILQMGVMMTLLFWAPSVGEDSNLLILCLLTAAWYLGSGIRASLLPALLAVLFQCELESAFTHLHIWSGLASMLMFALSDVICVNLKIYFLLALLLLGMTGYLGVEVTLIKETAVRRAEYIAIDDLDYKQNCDNM